MKKLFTLLTTTTLIAACGSSKDSSSSKYAKDNAKGNFALNVGNQKLELSSNFNKEVEDFKSKFTKLADKYGTDARIATDNLAIAEMLIEAGANLVALPEYPDTLESETIKYGTQKFNPKEYSCGEFDNQEVKKEGDKNVCYINGVKSKTITPIKNIKYGPVDTKKFYNLGFAYSVDSEQLKASKAEVFISTKWDVVETKVEGIDHIELTSFNTLEDIYKFASALEVSFAANKSFAPKYKYDIYQAYKQSSKLFEINEAKVPTVQFVYLDSQDNVWATTKDSAGNKIGHRFGFASSILGSEAKPIKNLWADYDFEISSKAVGKQIKSSDEIKADILVVFLASEWGLNTPTHSYNKIISGTEAYKKANVLYLEDSQYGSSDLIENVKEIVKKVYDK